MATFAPDGKTVATGGYVADDHNVQHGRILLWDISGPRQPKLRATLENPGDLTCLAFSPDGKSLAGVGYGGLVTLLDPATGRMLGKWQLPGEVKALLFAPDGRHLATANGNGTVYIFRIALRGAQPIGGRRRASQVKEALADLGRRGSAGRSRRDRRERTRRPFRPIRLGNGCGRRWFYILQAPGRSSPRP